VREPLWIYLETSFFFFFLPFSQFIWGRRCPLSPFSSITRNFIIHSHLSHIQLHTVNPSFFWSTSSSPFFHIHVHNKKYIMYKICILIEKTSAFSYPYPLNWGWHNLLPPCCDKDSVTYFTTGRLSYIYPPWSIEWLLTSANAAGTNGLTWGKARVNKFWSPTRWPTFANVAKLPRLHTNRTDWLTAFMYIHTYSSRFIHEEVAEVFQIFLRDTHVLPKLVSAINPLVAFYDIHGRKREVLLFYYVPDTTRD
jgi:hypothetical protein